ncbi:MAG: thioredoxin family protein [Actinobacteria bacterium]|jgi:thiol-disulfide isomerase/thioredoxin|nr:thioredoxin family protein [Actinomycetota bacterium]MBU1609245.1 thioredoxin family protein [Actinomycetota bacterium]MBU2315789.1 thioredoxin family protein [Actinomycetota bacterium]MBU2384562.1 thioredoxin family protein [Actinomycetota bacterium]
MTSPAPLLRLAGLATALALVVAGCTPVDDPTADPSSTVTPAPGASEPMDDDADDDAPDAGAGSSGDAGQAGAYVEYRDGIIADVPGTKALFFHAPWCPQCRALEESILSGEIPDDLTIIKVDFDTATGLRQQYGVTIQTTIVFVDDDGAALATEVLYSDTTLDALVAAAP